MASALVRKSASEFIPAPDSMVEVCQLSFQN